MNEHEQAPVHIRSVSLQPYLQHEIMLGTQTNLGPCEILILELIIEKS